MTESFGAVDVAEAVAPELLTPALSEPRPGSESARYLAWLAERGLSFSDWDELWRWSVDELEQFWQTIWDYFGVISHTPYETVLRERRMPGAEWFPGATLNLAEHALRPAASDQNDDDIAVVGYSQTRELTQLSFRELRDQVRLARAGLKALGVRRGDRVAGYLPNIPEALVAYLAAISLGAVWACCAPEFGTKGVVDRLAQVQPTVLFAVDGYRYGDKVVDRRRDVADIRAALPSVRHTVSVPYLAGDLDDATPWDALLELGAAAAEPLEFEAVPFDHPVSVLFTSGTTGLPKPIMHSHGGLLLEHFKNHALHWDLGAGDRLMWFTTTAWMMWNALASALILRASIVMIDGDPVHPDPALQWRLAEQFKPTVVGLSVGFLLQSIRDGAHPTAEYDLSSIRQLGIVGSPLPPHAYRWVAKEFGQNVLLNVGSGGTDVCTGIVQGSPLEPVWVGEMSGPALGVDACAFDEDGNEVVGELGELVIRAPMPSMPVGFWGDEDGRRYRASYFDKYPGVWRHGDWIRFSEVGSCVITGRSDATLNRGGVRLGTAEFYGVIEQFSEIVDSLVVHLDSPDGGMGELVLFVVPEGTTQLTDALAARLRAAIRAELSPRHTPDRVVAVTALPHTRTGKRLELPIKRILLGTALDEAVDPDAVDDPGALTQFVAMASEASTV